MPRISGSPFCSPAVLAGLLLMLPAFGCGLRPVQVARPELRPPAAVVAPSPVETQPQMQPPQSPQPVAATPSSPSQPPAAMATTTPALAGAVAAPDVVARENGSAPPVEPRVVYVEKMVLPDARFFDDRRRMYGEMDRRWQDLNAQITSLGVAPPAKWDACRTSLGGIVAGYGKIAERAGFDAAATETQNAFWDVLWSDLHFIGGECQLLADQAQQAVDVAFRRAAPGTALLDAGQRRPSPEILRHYAGVMIRQHNPAEAARLLLASLEGEPDTVAGLLLRCQAADLLLAAGNPHGARVQYQAVASLLRDAVGISGWARDHLAFLDAGGANQQEQLAAYRNVLLAHHAQQEGGESSQLKEAVDLFVAQFPASPLVNQARGLLPDQGGGAATALPPVALAAESEEAVAGDRIAGQIAEARSLVDIKEFQAARDILDDLLRKKLPRESEEEVRKELRAVDLAASDTRQMEDQHRQDQLSGQWEGAVRLFDQGRYDEAIAAFAAFRGTPHEKEAAEKVKTAMDRAATDRRREAADIYLKARKTNDSGRKRQLLGESLALLRDISRKYPEAGVIEKVAQNIKVLEKEIATLDQGGGAP